MTEAYGLNGVLFGIYVEVLVHLEKRQALVVQNIRTLSYITDEYDQDGTVTIAS
jgi:hypothetical protein